MATTFQRNSSEVVAVAPAALAKGASLYYDDASVAAFDLRAKDEAWFVVNLGLTDTTVPAAAVTVRFFPVVHDGTGRRQNAGSSFSASWLPSGTVAKTAVASGDGVAGERHVHVDATTNLAAGDKIMITDAARARCEFAKVSSPGTGLINLEGPLRYTHADADNDVITDNAESFAFRLPGGCRWACCISYEAAATGSDAVVSIMESVTNYYEQVTV